MTEFMRDVMYYGEMMARGEITYFEVDNYGSYFEIEADEEIRKYDCVSGERIF